MNDDICEATGETCPVSKLMNGLSQLGKENADLRQQIEIEKASTRLLKDCLHQAEQQIEEMKNCTNCTRRPCNVSAECCNVIKK